MTDDKLERRLSDLERRLSELEGRLLASGGESKVFAVPVASVEFTGGTDVAAPVGERDVVVVPVVVEGTSPEMAGVVFEKEVVLPPEGPPDVALTGTPALAPQAAAVRPSSMPPPLPVDEAEAGAARARMDALVRRAQLLREKGRGVEASAGSPVPAARPVTSAGAVSTSMPEAKPADTGRPVAAANNPVAAGNNPVAPVTQRPTGAGIGYATPKAVESAGTIERTLGVKWTAWLGALVLVLGAGLGLKFAYDQGWLGGLPPAARLVLFSLGSVALLGAGEWALRRVNRLASVGFFAAGVGSLFLVAYAGHAYYGLYASGTAFGLMAAATVVGALVAARADLVSIAVLSLLGGHMAPVVLGGNAGLGTLVAYLASLQVVGLVLAGRGGSQRWHTLRWLTLSAAGVWAAALGGMTAKLAGEVVVLAMVTAALGHVELLVRALREKADAGGERTGSPIYHAWLTGFALMVAVAYFDRPDARALLAGGAAVVAIAGAVYLCRVLRRGPMLRQLDLGFRAQALLILGLAVHEGLADPQAQWGFLGLACALGVWSAVRPLDAAASAGLPASMEAGAGTPSGEASNSVRGGGGVRLSGYVAPILALLACYQFTVLPRATEESEGVAQFASVAWNMNAVWGLVALAVAYAVTFLSLRPRTPATSHVGFAFAASVMLLFVAPRVTSPAMGVGIALAVAWAWTAASASKGFRAISLRPATHARGLLAGAGVIWLLFVVLGPRLGSNGAAGVERVLLNATAASGVLLAGSIFWITRVLRRTSVPFAETASVGMFWRSVVPTVGAVAVVFVAGLLELERVAMESGTAESMGMAREALRLSLFSAWIGICAVAWMVVGPRSSPAMAAAILRESTPLVVLVGAGALVAQVRSLMSDRDGLTPAQSLAAFGNSAFVCVVICVACALVFAFLQRRLPSRSSAVSGLTAVTVLLFAGAVELFRLVGRQDVLGVPNLIGVMALMTVWAMWVAFGTWLVARRFALPFVGYAAYPSAALLIVMLVAAVSTFTNQLVPWVWSTMGPRSELPVVNVQTGLAMVVLVALWAAMRLRRTEPNGLSPSEKFLTGFASVVGVLILFIATSADTARGLRSIAPNLGVANPGLLVMAGYSVWWALLALTAIAIGFAIRRAALRYFGLTLFGLTLVKVLLIDLATAGQGWRVLSLFAVGGILLLTNLLYGKVAPLLLRETPPTDQSPAA